MTKGRIRCYFICGLPRDWGPGSAARFTAELKSVVPNARPTRTGPRELELASPPWRIEVTPSVLNLEHDGLAVDWERFQQVASGILRVYRAAFGLPQVDTAVLGCTLNLDLPLEPQALERVFQVYPVLTHPLATGLEGFRLTVTFRGQHPEESLRIYLAGQPRPASAELDVIFELDYCRHFRKLAAPDEAKDWLNVAPVVLKELLASSLRERGELDL